MIRSELKNKYLKSRSETNWNNYKFQRNFCVNLLRKTKKQYFTNLDIKILNDNKKFWSIIKPFLSDKVSSSNKLMLVENDNLVSDSTSVATIMNKHFINITKNLNLKKYPVNSISHTVPEIIDTLKNHQ